MATSPVAGDRRRRRGSTRHRGDITGIGATLDPASGPRCAGGNTGQGEQGSKCDDGACHGVTTIRAHAWFLRAEGRGAPTMPVGPPRSGVAGAGDRQARRAPSGKPADDVGRAGDPDAAERVRGQRRGVALLAEDDDAGVVRRLFECVRRSAGRSATPARCTRWSASQGKQWTCPSSARLAAGGMSTRIAPSRTSSKARAASIRSRRERASSSRASTPSYVVEPVTVTTGPRVLDAAYSRRRGRVAVSSPRLVE